LYRTAFRNVLAHKGRLLMTVLAVFLGTAFVAGTLVFADSIEQSVEDSMSSNHSRVSVQVTDTAADPSSEAGSISGARLTESTVRGIAALPAARSVRGTVTGFAGLSDPHGNLIGSLGNTQGANWAPSANA